jgi:hypothetical protein
MWLLDGNRLRFSYLNQSQIGVEKCSCRLLCALRTQVTARHQSTGSRFPFYLQVKVDNIHLDDTS